MVTVGLLFTVTAKVVALLALPHSFVGSTLTEPEPAVLQFTTMLGVPWPDWIRPPDTVQVYPVAFTALVLYVTPAWPEHTILSLVVMEAATDGIGLTVTEVYTGIDQPQQDTFTLSLTW